MKVRHKATGVELEATKNTGRFGSGFYTTTGGSWIAVDDHEWEVVSDEEWEDVTRHCAVGRYELGQGDERAGHLYAIDSSNGGTNAFYNTAYRLRKIDGLHHGPAFIVERRKERT